MHRLDLEDPRLEPARADLRPRRERAPRALRRQAGAAPGGRRPADRVLRVRPARHAERFRSGGRARRAASAAWWPAARPPRRRSSTPTPARNAARRRTTQPLVVHPASAAQTPRGTPLAYVFESPSQRAPAGERLPVRDGRRRRRRPVRARAERGRGRARWCSTARARAGLAGVELALRVVVAGGHGVGQAGGDPAPGGPARRTPRSDDAGWDHARAMPSRSRSLRPLSS